MSVILDRTEWPGGWIETRLSVRACGVPADRPDQAICQHSWMRTAERVWLCRRCGVPGIPTIESAEGAHVFKEEHNSDPNYRLDLFEVSGGRIKGKAVIRSAAWTEVSQ